MLHEPTAFDMFFVTSSATENEYENLVCNVRTPHKWSSFKTVEMLLTNCILDLGRHRQVEQEVALNQ
jgi:hypothetical protein